MGNVTSQETSLTGKCDFPLLSLSLSLSLLTDSHSLSSHSFCRCLSSCQISWMRIETRFSLVSFINQLPMALRFTEKPEFGQVQELSFQFASFSSFEILVLPPLSFSPPPLPRVNGSGLVKVFHFISHFQESLSPLLCTSAGSIQTPKNREEILFCNM